MAVHIAATGDVFGGDIHCVVFSLKVSWVDLGLNCVSSCEFSFLFYRKKSKNWDTLNYYRDCPTNGIVGFYSAILRSKDADRITNRVDTDQTAP